jgi:hypothetical protein
LALQNLWVLVLVLVLLYSVLFDWVLRQSISLSFRETRLPHFIFKVFL